SADTRGMKRTLAAVMAMVFVFGACSGKKGESAGEPAKPSDGTSTQSVPADGALGSPILDGNDRGHYQPLKSNSSYEVLKGGSTASTNQNGLFLGVGSGD